MVSPQVAGEGPRPTRSGGLSSSAGIGGLSSGLAMAASPPPRGTAPLSGAAFAMPASGTRGLAGAPAGGAGGAQLAVIRHKRPPDTAFRRRTAARTKLFFVGE